LNYCVWRGCLYSDVQHSDRHLVIQNSYIDLEKNILRSAFQYVFFCRNIRKIYRNEFSFKQNVSNPNSQDNQDTECSLSESITTANSSSDIHVLPAESIASNREIKSSDTGRNSQFQQTRPRKSSCNIDESEVAESEMKDISQVNQESKRQYNLETKDNDHDKFEKNLGESSNNQFKSHSKEYRRNSNKNDTQRKESSNDRWGHGQENRKGHSSHENSNSYASQGSSGDKNRRYRDNESKPCPKNDGGENAECVPSDDSNKLRNKSNDRSNRKHNNYEGKPMLRNKAPDQEHVGENSDWKSQNSNKFRNKSGDRSNRYENYIGNDRSQNKIPDQEYDKFKTRYMSSRDDVMDCKVVQEIEGDLFTAGTEYSLGHCVSEDMNMGSGIAVLFRREFKRVDELLSQRRTQGNVAILEDKGRFVYYLVTKRASFGKPTYHTLWLSLQKMKDHIRTNNVKKLALPRIGCGLDSLEWKYVKNMLEYIFQNVDIQIVIYNFQQDSSSTTQTKLRKCPVVNTQKLLSEIDTGTIMVYFGSE
ncbi:hypothetical protein AMK59_4560, partial [Oryctes borbonicus]